MYKDKETSILGVHVNNWGKERLYDHIKNSLLSTDKKAFLITPNPEIALQAFFDSEYRSLLNKSDISIADGVGLFFGNLVLQHKILKRYTGVETTKFILNSAHENNLSVGVILHPKSLTSKDELEAFIKSKYPNIKLEVVIYQENLKQIISHVSHMKLDIVFCALGAPVQEKVAYEIYKKVKSVRFVMGNGGSFDFITKKIKRSPVLMQKFGIEWLWRLFLEPRYRAKRIFNAVIKFPLAIIYWKVRSWFVYRHTVVGCILNNKNDILIAHLPQYNQWGIPQGGHDAGESLKQTALREMNEELGIRPDLLKPVAIKRNIYSYKWRAFYRLIRGFRGQRQSVVYLRFLGKDGDIHLDNYELDKWKWVSPKELLETVSPVRKKSAELVLKYLPQDKLKV